MMANKKLSSQLLHLTHLFILVTIRSVLLRQISLLHVVVGVLQHEADSGDGERAILLAAEIVLTEAVVQ